MRARRKIKISEFFIPDFPHLGLHLKCSFIDMSNMSMQLMSVHHHQLLIAQCEVRCHRPLVLSHLGPPVLSDPSLEEGPGAVPATTRRHSSMAVEQRKPRHMLLQSKHLNEYTSRRRSEA